MWNKHNISILLSFLLLCGCSTNKNQIKRLSEKEVAQQEQIAEQARKEFCCGNYQKVPEILDPLCLERTTSQPLYLCEIGASYLAVNDKINAKKYLLDAYNSIEGFFDPSSEKKAVSLWGSEAEKVYKGEPYEQASMSLLVGLLLLEEGEIDNALACFKNGQFADADVDKEQYKSDFGLLQLLESKCLQMRGEQLESDLLFEKAIDSFAYTHPRYILKQTEIDSQKAILSTNKTKSKKNSKQSNIEKENIDKLEAELINIHDSIVNDYRLYYEPLRKPYNTLLLVWTGRSPEMVSQGQYGEQRVMIKNPPLESHYEIIVDGSDWYDVIRGFANITYQATTRGGRMMDNVLADQAAFKAGAHNFSKSLADTADDVSDPYAALAILGVALIAEGVSASANVKADIRCWRTLPDKITVVPIQLEKGEHEITLDCYDNNFRVNRRKTYHVSKDETEFQFFNLVVPTRETVDMNDVALNTIN